MDSRNPKFMGNKFALSNITYSLYDAVFLTFGTFEVNYSIQKGYAEEKHPGSIKCSLRSTVHTWIYKFVLNLNSHLVVTKLTVHVKGRLVICSIKPCITNHTTINS